MVVTIPKALVPLTLALVLLAVAVTLLSVSHKRPVGDPTGANTVIPVAVSSDASPGSTAHARHAYLASLGR